MAKMAADPKGLKDQVIAHATDSLDGAVNATAWLESPSPGFEGRTPYQVLAQGDLNEMQRLEEILTALDYGMHP